MARPLPKDLQDNIAGTAKKSEVRSVGAFGFALGIAFGFGLGAAVFSDASEGKGNYFLIGAGVFCLLWFFSSRRKG